MFTPGLLAGRTSSRDASSAARFNAGGGTPGTNDGTSLGTTGRTGLTRSPALRSNPASRGAVVCGASVSGLTPRCLGCFVLRTRARSRVTCSRIELASCSAMASSRPNKCLSSAIIPSGDCLMKSMIVRVSPIVLGIGPLSISTRFADCSVPTRGSMDMVTLLCESTSSTKINVSHATCRRRSKSWEAASCDAMSTWNLGRLAAATAADAAAAVADGSLPLPPLPLPPLPPSATVLFGSLPEPDPVRLPSSDPLPDPLPLPLGDASRLLPPLPTPPLPDPPAGPPPSLPPSSPLPLPLGSFAPSLPLPLPDPPGTAPPSAWLPEPEPDPEPGPICAVFVASPLPELPLPPSPLPLPLTGVPSFGTLPTDPPLPPLKLGRRSLLVARRWLHSCSWTTCRDTALPQYSTTLSSGAYL